MMKVPMFIISFFLGERSQVLNTNLELDTNKLRGHGFKCQINNLSQMFKN